MVFGVPILKLLCHFLQDLNIEKALEIVKRFKEIVTDIVDSVKRGVELLKKLMSGGYLSNLVDEFVSSVRSIPETVQFCYYHCDSYYKYWGS